MTFCLVASLIFFAVFFFASSRALPLSEGLISYFVEPVSAGADGRGVKEGVDIVVAGRWNTAITAATSGRTRKPSPIMIIDRVLNIAAIEPGTLFASQVVSEDGSTGIIDPGCKERHTIFGSNGDLSWYRISDSKARLGGESTGMFAIFFERGIVA